MRTIVYISHLKYTRHNVQHRLWTIQFNLTEITIQITTKEIYSFKHLITARYETNSLWIEMPARISSKALLDFLYSNPSRFMCNLKWTYLH